MFLIVFFIAPVLVLVFIYYLLCYFWDLWKLRKFAGPTPLPILGNILSVGSKKGRIERLLAYQDKYGDFKLFIGPEAIIFLSSLKALEAVLDSNTNLTKSKQYTFLKNWLGNGLLFSGGDYWHRHRKIITSILHLDIMEKYIESFNMATNTLISCLDKNLGKASFDIYPSIDLCTLDIMCESSMGPSFNVQINPEADYITNIKKIKDNITNRIFTVFKQYDLMNKMTSNYRREKKSLKILDKYTNEVINKKILEIGNRQNCNDASSIKRCAFIDLLLLYNSDGDTLSDQEVKEEVNTLLFKGYSTIASSIAFALYCIANNPEVQEKIYLEIAPILENNFYREATIQDLKQMRYLEAHIRESLRLYPPIPFYGRKLTTDVEYDDKILSKGTTIGIYAMGVHYNPEFYQNPRSFNPDRFSTENKQHQNSCLFLPFSAGPRNCIAQEFAMLIIKYVLSKILRHYRLLPPPEDFKMELVIEGVLRSNNGILIGIEKRS